MTKQVWKYEVPHERGASLIAVPHEDFTYAMPSHATILYGVYIVNGSPVFYAEVDPSEPYAERKFHVRGTGVDIEDNEGCDYALGSWVQPVPMHADLVWHLFEDWQDWMMDTSKWPSAESQQEIVDAQPTEYVITEVGDTVLEVSPLQASDN